MPDDNKESTLTIEEQLSPLDPNTVDQNPKNNPETDALEWEKIIKFQSAFDSLPERTRIVLSLRLGLDGEPKSLSEIGKELKISRERVRQIEIEASRKIRKTLKVRWHFGRSPAERINILINSAVNALHDSNPETALAKLRTANGISSLNNKQKEDIGFIRRNALNMLPPEKRNLFKENPNSPPRVEPRFRREDIYPRHTPPKVEDKYRIERVEAVRPKQ